MDHESVKAKLLAKYGDTELGALCLYLPMVAAQEGRRLGEEELLALKMCDLLYKAVRSQMHRLASACEEPVWDPANLNEEDERGLSDYLAFERGDEKIAARANLVKLHEPIPDDLEGEDLDHYLDERPRETFVPLVKITVREAFNYVDYWTQEAETDEALRGFLDHWKGVQEIAQLTGDKPPETIGEYVDYCARLAEEEKEEE